MSIVTIPDSTPANGRLGVAWGVGNQLAVHPRAGSGPGSRAGPGQGTRVHEVRWETTLYEPVFRKLVNESSGVFQSLARASEEERAVGAETLVRVSRQYRSIMKDCQEQLEQLAETRPAAQAAHYLGQSELLYKLELIWHLVEILYLDTTPGGLVLPHLLHWTSLHFTGCEDRARSVLSQASEEPEQHAEYWEAVTRFVLQGRLEQARNLLKLHSEFSTDPFLSLDELLRKMPACSANTSAADFEFRWRSWQVEVVARIQEGEFAAFPELAHLAGLLAGQEESLERAAREECEVWYEWLVASLLYTRPAVRAYDLGVHGQQAVDKYGGLSGMTTLDSVLLAVLENDIPQVVRELCLSLDNFWYSAHLLDLLHHTGLGLAAGWRQDGAEEAGAGLREFLLLDYATCLGSHHSLWQVALLYLDQCPVQGRHRAELLLERVPLTTEYKANKVVQMAADRGLNSVVTATCKVMGMKALQRNNVGSAMAWALQSGDAKFTTFLADRLLAEYANSGTFSSTDLLDNLGASIIVSDRLTFLGKYREFHRLVSDSQFAAAASLLHSLLWSKLAPKYFWVTLLIDCIPFLTADQVLFSSAQTYELLECLQELGRDTTLPAKQALLLEEHEMRLRLALAKNLGAALTREGDSATLGPVEVF